MKTMVIGSLMATFMAFQVVGQRAENDDMYFNSKDRKKLNESAIVDVKVSSNDKIDSDYQAFKKKHFDGGEETAATTEEITTNPTDSYSANVNPEYIARSNSKQASEEESYYEESTTSNATDSYSSGTYNNNNYNNNNFYNRSSGWNTNWYGRYSPYYGYCDPWMSPYYSGGSGMTITYGNSWGSPYYSYSPYYSPYNSYSPYGYSPYGYYSPYNYSPYSYYGNGYGSGYPYYYGSSDYYSGVNYGKRPSRHSSIVTPTPRFRQQNTSSSNNTVDGRSRRTSDEYYVKPAKRTWENMTSEPTSTDRSTRPSNSGSLDNSRTRTRESSTSPSYSPPSRSSSSGSSPSRSSSGSSSSPRRRN